MNDRHGTKHLKRSGALVTAWSVVAMLISFVFQMTVAAYFGAGVQLDAFWVGATLPQYFQAVTVGVISVVLIPQMAQMAEREGDDYAQATAGGVCIWLAALLAFMCLAGAVFSAQLIRMLAPGLAPPDQETASSIARIMWPTLLFFGISAAAGAMLHWNGRFLLPALAPALGGLVSVLLLLGLPNHDVRSIAWALTASAFVQVVLLWSVVLRARLVRLNGVFSNPDVFKTLRLGLPLLLSAMVVRITPLVDRFLASELAPGTISHLGYSFRLVTVGAGIFTAGIGAVILPRMSISAARADPSTLSRSFAGGISMMWSVVVPIVALGLVLAHPVVELLFERGRFGAEDTAAVATALQIYLLAFPAMALGVLTGRMIYALQAVKVAAVIGVVEAAAYVAFTFALVHMVGWVGIPIGFVLYYSLSLAWQVAYLNRRLDPHLGKKVTASAWRPTVSAVAAGVAVWVLPSVWPGVVVLVVGILLGMLVYVLALRMLRAPELDLLVSHLPRRRAALAGPDGVVVDEP